jgi:integrase
MAKSFSKRDSRYWYGKIFQQTQANGQTDANWSMRLAIGGKRRQLSLDSGNKQSAAERAAAIYASARDAGWDAALTEYASRRKPTPPPPASASVGDVIRIIEERGTHLRSSTKIRIYSALRVIASSAAGIAEYDLKATNAAKSARRDAIDRVPLEAVTPELIRRWQREFIAGADDDLQLACKKRSADGTIAAFSRVWTAALAPHYADAGLILPPNPAKSVKLFRLKTPRYKGAVDAGALISDAKDQLSADAYRTLVLALQFGLRRAEIDRLQWQHVDLSAGQLSVQSTEAGATKTGASERVLDIAPGMVALLAEWQAGAIGDYVVAPLAALRPKRWSAYRADAAFEEVLKWLRGRGWDSVQPLHQLRKEFGSAVNQKFGLFAASSALGHTSIVITAAHYVATKGKIHLEMPDLPA